MSLTFSIATVGYKGGSPASGICCDAVAARRKTGVYFRELFLLASSRFITAAAIPTLYCFMNHMRTAVSWTPVGTLTTIMNHTNHNQSTMNTNNDLTVDWMDHILDMDDDEVRNNWLRLALLSYYLLACSKSFLFAWFRTISSLLWHACLL